MNLYHKILFDWMGFREEVSEPFPAKYIIALAPHTSNWDFIIGMLFCRAKNFNCNFLMKKEWFFWPLGKLMHKLGGIPVYRSKKTGLTDIVAEKAKEMDTFRLCITPEGTRKANKEWKKGFYYIALKANIPILLYGLDYKRKLIKCSRTFIPTGNVEKDMEEIKQYFTEFEGKHPERFII
ncbi:MAG: 1-acyl-sn-glycerol-3-phosphate acyltransferase [Bacteroidaceae bacterium]|nr:1-acyl-sn-glycerol-3-phosphate acyltransferase [Bacteroidaceae bacterium]MBQ5393063.1 1-acyl-sn-glycerol-3-phosphate acyltransferase [Bacteroidaceae bacterium]